MVVVIEDDGRGFGPALETAGAGLDAIRERLLDGRFPIESSESSGTTLVVEVAV